MNTLFNEHTVAEEDLSVLYEQTSTSDAHIPLSSPPTDTGSWTQLEGGTVL